MSLQSFLAMGGYAEYVWPAYAVFLIVLGIDYFAPAWRRRQLLREVHARAVRQQQRRARHAQGRHVEPHADADTNDMLSDSRS